MKWVIAPGSRGLGLLLTALAALGVLLFGLHRPQNNWDLIGYIAVASSADGYHGADLNRVTMDSVRAAVNPSKFEEMARQDDYRRTVSSDPLSLAQQLPFYRIRVLYVQTLRMVHAATGLGYPKTAYLVSAVFAAISVWLTALLCYQSGVPLVAAPVIAVTAGMLLIASFSTPDAMACAFALLALSCALRHSGWLFVVVPLLPLVRTDFILLSALLCAYAFLNASRMFSVVSMLISAIAYAIAARGGYGWLTLFNMSFIHKVPYPASLVPSHAIRDYLQPYIPAALGLAMHPQGVIYGLGILVACLARSAEEGAMERTRFMVLLVVPMAFVAAHLLFFPAPDFRFFVFAATAVMIWLMTHLRAPGNLGHSITT